MKLKALLVGSMLAGTALCQETKPKFSMDGQLAAATDGKGIFVNLGGPSLKFHFEKFSVALGMMPSLRFQNETAGGSSEAKLKPLVTPMLGFGPQLYLLKNRRLLFTFPAYYNTSNRLWTFTGGVGYVLTSKKK